MSLSTGCKGSILHLLLHVLYLLQLTTTTRTINFLGDGSYNATIYENSRPRTHVLCEQLMGVDLSNIPVEAHISYSITDGDEDGFFIAEAEEIGGVAVMHIRTKTGMKDVLNRERRDQYNLRVSAVARGPGGTKLSIQLAHANIIIHIQDMNDNIPLFFPNMYKVTVDEGVMIHTSVLKLSAHDADSGPNGHIYYSLKDPNTNEFAVNPTSGDLSITRVPKMLNSSMKVVILAQDRGHQLPGLQKTFSHATVQVFIQPVNNHDPNIVIKHLPSVIVHAHASIYAIINISDEDSGPNGEIDYIKIIAGDPDRLFSVSQSTSVNPNEYNLSVLNHLDRELAPSGYNLTLVAIDKGTPPRQSHTNIQVKILDINDHAPVFNEEQYEEAVSENVPPHTPVVKLTAYDTDLKTNGHVQYSLTAGNERGLFIIDPVSGVISTTDWLDADDTAYYSLIVSALDQPDIGNVPRRKQSSAKVIIRVLDENDNEPKFSLPGMEVTVDENKPVGSYVTRVEATDLDSGENGFISYSIANLDEVPFTIDQFDGIVRTSSILDFESKRRSYDIKIRASDWGTPFKRETETEVKVKVHDVNDNRPVMVNSECTGWVRKDAPQGTNILTMIAMDLDLNDIVTYKLHGDNEDSCWSISTMGGILSLICNLKDYLKYKTFVPNFAFNVTATDGANHISDPARVTIKIINSSENITELGRSLTHVECRESGIRRRAAKLQFEAAKSNAAEQHYALLPLRYGINNHDPEFPIDFPEKLEVSEDVAVGHRLLKVLARDHDKGFNGQVVFAISGGGSYFRIGIESGVLEVWTPLDYEKVKEYQLNLTVSDLGIPHRTISRKLKVNVLDINDNAPEFNQLSYSLHLPEDTTPGTSVAHVKATDADHGIYGELSYHLMTDSQDFRVDSITGIVYVARSLDRERYNEYDLRVWARDLDPTQPRSSFARLLITLLDVNDCSPDFGTIDGMYVSIPEDMPVGAVIATFSATDQDLGDGGQITYSLQEVTPTSFFRIDSTTGVVRVSHTLDFESWSTHNLTVQAKDHGNPPLQSQATLIVKVLDVDENIGAPSFPQHLVQASVHEGQAPGTTVTTLIAHDVDEDGLSYAITDGSGIGYFTIDDKGTVRTLRILDRESSRGYWITVVVTDGGTNPLYDTCQVWVAVKDINDHVPQTLQPAYHVFIPENADRGAIVIALQAIDGDVSISNISFTFINGNENHLFHINERSGAVTVAGALDRGHTAEYELTVSVSDGELSSTTHLTITVTDVNNHKPHFLESLYRISVPSRLKSKRREQLFRVFAVDDDIGPNASLEYSIKENRGKRFKIHPKTGQIFTTKAFLPGEMYEIAVEAKDSGSPSLNCSARVILRVIGIPESSPNFPIIQAPDVAHVMENEPPGQLLAFIHAHDDDNDTLWYYIISGDSGGRFSLGVDTGIVSLARPLDHENHVTYTLTITVTDGVHTATEKFIVVVVDANDHRPLLSQSVYEAKVLESAKVGTTVLTLSCRDKDAYNKDIPVYYSVHHSNSTYSDGLFSLDSASGNLIVASPLDREVKDVHQLTVSCHDRGRRERVDYSRVNIWITDDNDHPPVFTKEMEKIKVCR